MAAARKTLTVITDVKRFVREDELGNELVYYSGVISSDEAKDITFVPVMKELHGNKSPLNEVQGGYQRPGLGTRMRAFGRYLEATELAIVPPVLLSTRGRWRFVEEDGDFGHIEVQGQAAIIDGQHRLGGFIYLFEANEEVRAIDFVAYDGLDADEEARVFNTINGNAKGVPKGVGAVIDGEWSTQVALRLKEDSGSPFQDKIFIAAKREIPGALFNLSSMQEQIRRTFSHGSFASLTNDEDVDAMYSIAERYWETIAEAFSEEWEDINRKPKDQEFKLLELTGIIAWSLAAGDILGPNFDSNSKSMDWEAVEELITQLADSGLIDWTKSGEFANATGAVGGPKIHRKIQQALAQIR
jgi:DNA sulfur modification protein DndB